MVKEHVIKRACRVCGEPFLQNVRGGLFNDLKCIRCTVIKRTDRARYLTPDQYADSVLKSLPRDKDYT